MYAFHIALYLPNYVYISSTKLWKPEGKAWVLLILGFTMPILLLDLLKHTGMPF